MKTTYQHKLTLVTQVYKKRAKCRLFGHDWLYRRQEGERECLRCTLTEDYTVGETHHDESAEKGAKRYRIEDETLFIEEYTVSAWGENSEEWRWVPTGTAPASTEHLLQLRDEINQELDSAELV